ncbi:MAG: flagellar biosynthesis protein FlgN [Spirochaetes bacterium]|nr:MAG: flagellar biosynthesis protein FlgN [Spirochaetota bacterium]
MATATTEDTEIDIEERINILKKLRETLLKQKERFVTYLDVLEKEERSINEGDIDKLELQIHIEEEIVKEITNFEKVISPLDDLYKRAYPVEEKSIPKLKNSLENIRKSVLKKNKRNRVLLKEKMDAVRHEIKSLKVKHDIPSPYADIGVPTLVDITT